MIALPLVLLVAGQGPAGEAPLPRRIDVKAIEWQAPTEPVVLGETESVSLTLKATRGDGSPLDVAPPDLWASAGALSPPERTAPGAWTTSYTPPPERYPHVAILSAQLETTEGPAVGFLSLPLWGKGRLEVKTKPESSVTVYLGNESFGPAAANDEGVARVDIIAPPGPERAVAESTDQAGNQSSKPVPLGVPSFSRLALMPIDDVAAADGTGEAQLLLFVVDKKGAPLFDASQVKTSADVGTFAGEPLGLAPGVFRLRYRPGETKAEAATIKVALEASEASQATADIQLLSGRPVKAELELSRTELSADDKPAVTVKARWFDKAGNPSPRSAVRLSVDHGRIADVEALPDEAQRFSWILPPGQGVEVATLTARATTGEVLSEAEVTLKPGRPAALEILPIDPVISDGKGAAEVVVRATDVAGTTVPPTGVEIDTGGAGTVAGTAVKGDVLTARFVPSPVEHEEVVTLIARLGDVEARRDVRVKPAARPLLSVGVGARADWNYGRLLALGPDISMMLRIPGVLDETLHAGINVGVLPSVPLPVAAVDRSEALWRMHVSYPLLFEGAWRPLVWNDLTFHLGAGVGATVGDLTLGRLDGGVPQRSIFFAFGGQVSVGAAYRLGPGEIEALLRAGGFWPVGGHFFGTPTGIGLVVGYRFDL